MNFRTIGFAVALAGILGFVDQLKAQSSFTINLMEVGGDVVGTGNGTIDFTDLAFDSTSTSLTGIAPAEGILALGPVSGGADTIYTGLNAPSPFGPGSITLASAGSGDLAGIALIADGIVVPAGYLSGSPLSDSVTFSGATFASLGVTPGTYEWTWGSGLDAGTFTLNAVPEPSEYGLLVFLAVAGVFGWKRRISVLRNV